MTDDFGGFFDDALKGGGGGAPGFKFGAIGSGIRGTITDIFKTKVTKMNSTDPKLDKNGNEIPQLNVTIQTDLRNWDKVTKVPLDDDEKPLPASEDTGLRRLFVKYQMARAVGEAIQAAGAKSSDFKKGAEIAVKYVSDQPMQEGSMKIYEARFTKGEPSAEDFNFGNEVEESPFAEPAQAEAPAAAPAQDDEPPF